MKNAAVPSVENADRVASAFRLPNRPLRFGLFLVLSLCVLAVLEPVAAQTGYSLTGANALVARKDWNGLLTYTQGWSRANRNDSMPWYYRGQTLGYGLNEPAQAVTAFRRALSMRQQWPEAWHALAFTSVQARQYDEAVKAVGQAIAQDPNRPNYYNTLAVAYSFEKAWDNVIQTLRDEQQHMGRATSYDWYNLGNGYANSGHLQEAINAYNQSLRMNANYGNAWNNLAVAEQLAGNDQAAMADYKRASQLGNGLSAGNFKSLQQRIAAARAAATQSSGPGGPVRCVPWMNTPFNSNCGYSGHDPCPHPLTICSR
jgi:tetratricopeptide (TPR) repeat protein